MTDTFFEEEEFQTQFNGRTVVRILQQAMPYWPMLLGFLATITLVSFQDSIFTYITKRIVDDAIIARNADMLRQLLILYGGLTLLQSVWVFGFIYLAGVLGERIRYDLRKKMFNHLQTLSFSYFDRTPIGWIMSRVTSDSERIAELVTWGLLDITWGFTNISIAVIFMFLINWKMALIVVVIVPILVIVAAQFKVHILDEFRIVRKINSKITGAYNENIMGVRVTKSLTREEQDLGEFQVLTRDMYQAAYRAAWLSALFLPVVQLLVAVGVSAVVWYGGIQVEAGGMSIGDIQAFVSYITFMMWPVQEMARVYAQMQQSIASAERAFSLIDSVPEVQDKVGAIEPETLRGDIVFDHVDFYYEVEKPVLSDFSLHVRHGETIALVGPTGGGKSTIVNLLCRFYEPKQGVITIAGHDYTDLTLHAIHSQLGMVLQTPHLFSGTIRENIRYGRLQASDEDVVEAAHIAGAHDFIVTLDKGYDTDVGEGGNLLSVGQKQLISLARAILAQPEIFIMDEATSSVDTLTEALIQRGMDAVMNGRTSFIIAHRLSTIKRADRILVIENGRIAEMGSHAELIRQQGHYYRLYTQQFRRERAAAYDLGMLPLTTSET
ncbi:MAG: ABC transporter ATP-binding protein [Chloroflexota bacterium]